MNNRLGFTIVELMVSIAVAAVLVTLAVPSFGNLLERNQLAGNINNFVSSLTLARSEAIKRKQTVVLCASNDSDGCTAESDYDQGWIVYVETAAIDSGRTENDETLLWVGEALPTNMSLRGNQNIEDRIVYRPTGRSVANGSVFLCKDEDVNRARLLTIINSGRVHQAELNADGVPLKSDGNEIEDCG